MKIKDNWLIIVMLLLNLGVILYYERKPIIAEPPPDYMWVKMDPNSSRTYTAILMPKLNETYKEIWELKTQNRWLSISLDKCLRMLEIERGLEPMIPEYDLSLKGEPNIAEKYSQQTELFFRSYEEPNEPPLLEEPESNIRYLVCLMGISEASNRIFIDDSADWIENFEERMKRIDQNQPR